jgi:hypothetical protein
MSLDSYVAAPNDDVGRGLGEGGECLHYWIFGGPWTYGGDAGLAPSAAVIRPETSRSIFIESPGVCIVYDHRPAGPDVPAPGVRLRERGHPRSRTPPGRSGPPRSDPSTRPPDEPTARAC